MGSLRERDASGPALDIGGTPYPGYVTTDEDRRRWDIARQLAVALFEGDDAQAQSVWQATRALYHSELPS